MHSSLRIFVSYTYLYIITSSNNYDEFTNKTQTETKISLIHYNFYILLPHYHINLNITMVEQDSG